ncbi:MAG: hypothetical protein RI988_1218 [Pseudomonadota bacterium]|jgi:Cu/Ag efflux protein CusF
MNEPSETPCKTPASLAWRRRRVLAACVLGAALPLAWAQAPEWIDAEVRKIDKDAGRLTLKHAEIKALDMPPMTMVFRVRTPAMLDGLAVGDRVRFQLVREAGQFVVTAIQRAN